MQDTLILLSVMYVLFKLTRLVPVEIPPYIETKEGYLIRDKEKWASDLLLNSEKE